MTILDAKRLYPSNSESDMSMMTPAADELDKAIEAKDSAKFLKAFSKVTAACNSCHEATGFGLITIRDPRLSPIQTSPFSDESFTGKCRPAVLNSWPSGRKRIGDAAKAQAMPVCVHADCAP